MTRQFFVGGNFKMNPCSQEEKLALVKVLNEAELDQSTGASYVICYGNTSVLIYGVEIRGCGSTPSTLYYSIIGDDQKGHQGFRTELLRQGIWSVYG